MFNQTSKKMKSQKQIIVLLMLLVFSTTLSQHRNSRTKIDENKISSKIDDTNKEINDVNESVENSTKTIERTTETLEETWGVIKGKFGGKKSKNNISIIIRPISYDNEHLNNLYRHISKASGVKKSTKSYNANVISISLDCKNTADDIWQDVPKNIRSNFKIVEIGEKNIILNPVKFAE